MKPKLLIAPAAAAVLAAGACTSQTPDAERVPPVWVPVSAQLAAYESCDDALEGIQEAAISAYRAMESNNDDVARGGAVEDFAAEAEEGAGADSAATAADGSFSETNNAVAGVDEPDIVKTDGTFVYSAVDQVLRVVDTRSAEVVAERELSSHSWGHQLFLGDDELLLMYTQDVQEGETFYSEFRLDRLDAGTLETLDAFAMDGSMVDARLVDGEVRLAVGSQPRIDHVWESVWHEDADATSIAEAVRSTEIEDWLPGFRVNGDEQRVDCGAVAHPERFTGTSVSVFALPADGDWTETEPQTVMADGETVHGTADSLYLAHYDYAWGAAEPEAESEIYRFVFADGRARLAGEAAVPGTLLNQYSLSEYDGHLRVATTEDNAMSWWGGCGPATACAWEGEVAPRDQEPSKSTVTVFAVGEDALTETGSVTDLGVDEQIYAVRFLGDTGYVVTFRQTDPLYTVDLSDPANPVVTGELKITGYSGYLHPVGEDRLLGVGQEATAEGRTTGLQASLFDTGAAEASVLDQYYREGAESSVQWDPHAFLYWADTGIAVLPVNDWDAHDHETGAVVLGIGAASLTEAAWIDHDVAGGDPYDQEIQRALVIGDQLWTLSNSGLQANTLGDGYEQTSWAAF